MDELLKELIQTENIAILVLLFTNVVTFMLFNKVLKMYLDMSTKWLEATGKIYTVLEVIKTKLAP